MPAGQYDRSHLPRRGRPGAMLKRVLDGDTSRDWMIRAACARGDLPPDQLRAFAEIFFPTPGRSDAAKRRYRQQAAAAKAICYQCPVRQRCHYHAEVLAEENGIWGGLTEEERSELRNERKSEELEENSQHGRSQRADADHEHRSGRRGEGADLRPSLQLAVVRDS